MVNHKVLDWLLKGDVSIQYQVHRDLLGVHREDIQNKIAKEGWGYQFLAERHSSGHWGDRFYQPKWISTHYTLLDLRNLNINPNNEVITESIELVLNSGKADDGGIPLGPSTQQHSDVCVNAMFLNYASYFQIKEDRLTSIVDSILNEIMPDGGFNCRSTRSGAKHSSLHSTISVLEGLFEFVKSGHTYRSDQINAAITSATAFILWHRLFRSDRTGDIISNDFLKFRYPCRWKYDILRALDFFQYANIHWDDRMDDAIHQLTKNRRSDETWNLRAAHPGQVHFVMEKAGAPSRWNTLRALRVLNHFNRVPEVNRN